MKPKLIFAALMASVIASIVWSTLRNGIPIPSNEPPSLSTAVGDPARDLSAAHAQAQHTNPVTDTADEVQGSPPATLALLQGSVRTTDGEAVVGARVTLSEAGARGKDLRRRLRDRIRKRRGSSSISEPTDDTAAAEAETTTDANGAFHFPFPTATKVTLRAEHANYLKAKPLRLDLSEADPHSFDAVTLTLPVGAFIRGRIIDADGNPVDGVTVRSRRSRAALFDAQTEEATLDPTMLSQQFRKELQQGVTNRSLARRQTESDSNGQFRLGPLPAASYRLLVEHAQYPTLKYPTGDDSIELTLDSDADIGEVRFAPAATLIGQVVDPQGEPIADVHISRQRDGFPSPALGGPFNRTQPRGGATTDAAGKFKLEGQPLSASYTVRAQHPSYLAANHGPTEVSSTEIAQQFDLGVITLTEGVSFSGVITNEAGEPLRRSKVTLRKIDEDESNTATHQASPMRPFGTDFMNRFGSHRDRSDASGRFEISPIEAGTYNVLIQAKGYAPIERQQLLDRPTDLAIALTQGVTISGVVSDARGEPVRAQVRARRVGSTEPRAFRHTNVAATRCDSTGAFELTGLDASLEYDLFFSAKGFADQRLEAQHARAHGVAVTMLAHSSLEGFVTDSAGHPIPEFTVSILPRGEASFARSLRGRKRFKNGDGSYLYGKIDPGEYQVTVQATGKVSSTQAISIAADQQLHLDATLTGGTILRGRLVAHDQTPIASARLRCRAAGSNAAVPSLRTRSRDDGSFEFSAVASGVHELHVQHRDVLNPKLTIEIAAGSSELDLGAIELEPGATLSGEVVDSNGQALSRVMVRLEPPSVSAARSASKPTSNASPSRVSRDGSFTAIVRDGKFERRGLPAGEYQVSVVPISSFLRGGRGTSPAVVLTTVNLRANDKQSIHLAVEE